MSDLVEAPQPSLPSPSEPFPPRTSKHERELQTPHASSRQRTRRPQRRPTARTERRSREDYARRTAHRRPRGEPRGQTRAPKVHGREQIGACTCNSPTGLRSAPTDSQMDGLHGGRSTHAPRTTDRNSCPRPRPNHCTASARRPKGTGNSRKPSRLPTPHPRKRRGSAEQRLPRPSNTQSATGLC